MQVTVKNLYISSGHNYYGRYGKKSLNYAIVERNEIQMIAGRGIVDDRFFDHEPNYRGQITFFDWAVYQRVMSEIIDGDLDPKKFRRNVLIEGVDLNELIGKKFTLNGVTFTGSCECRPCFWMDEACAEGTEEFLKGKGGLRARILNDGSLTKGEYELDIIGDTEVDDGK